MTDLVQGVATLIDTVAEGDKRAHLVACCKARTGLSPTAPVD